MTNEVTAHPDTPAALHPSTVPFLAQLRTHGVVVVVYGSQGVAMHLGRFKVPGDLDLLVEDEWVGRRCDQLTAIMSTLGFTVSDASEHEYRNESGFDVAFASQSILQRDGVVAPNEDPFIAVRVAGEMLTTLTATAFRRAYAFSLRDGYRLEQRGKNDARVLALLDAHIAQATSLDAAFRADTPPARHTQRASLGLDRLDRRGSAPCVCHWVSTRSLALATRPARGGLFDGRESVDSTSESPLVRR